MSSVLASSPQLIGDNRPDFRFPGALNKPQGLVISCLLLLRIVPNTSQTTSNVTGNNNSLQKGGTFSENITCAPLLEEKKLTKDQKIFEMLFKKNNKKGKKCCKFLPQLLQVQTKYLKLLCFVFFCFFKSKSH